MLGGAMAGLYGMIEVTAIQGTVARRHLAAATAISAFWWPGWPASARCGSSSWRRCWASFRSAATRSSSAGLPSSTTNILMALILFFVLGSRSRGAQVSEFTQGAARGEGIDTDPCHSFILVSAIRRDG